MGWWESVDEARGEPIPFPKVIKISELQEHERTLAHVLVMVGMFKSIGQARKNGFNKPLEPAELWFKNRTIRLQIQE